MIDSSKELPTVELGGGVLVLEPSWLVPMLNRAALAAGHTPWWPAEHIATTVQAFFQSTLPSQPISFQRFRSSVHRVLEQLGHPDVARQFLNEGMDLGFSLLDLVARVPAGFELALFEECDRSLQVLLHSGAVARAYVWNVAPGIKRFLRKTHWNRKCDHLRDELVHHLRQRLVQLTPNGSISLFIRSLS